MAKGLKYLLLMLLLILGYSGEDDLRQEIEALKTRVITLEKGIYFYCTAMDGTPGVELWRECYSTENTTRINLSNNQLTGEIPSEIGNLTDLTHFHLHDNQLTGEIPSEVCDLIESNNLDINYILNGNNLINTCE